MVKKQKQWYARWWAIGIYVIVGLILIQNFFIDSDVQFLEDQNYEVLDYGYNEVAKDSPNYDPDGFIRDFAHVKMKGLGTREDQVASGFIFLGNKYKRASEYNVVILTENERCSYRVDGEIYRAYLSGLTYWSTDNPILMNKSDIEKKIHYTLWAGLLKAELTKLANGEETEKEYDSYDIKIMLREYDKLNNTQIDRDTIYEIVQYYENDGFCE